MGRMLRRVLGILLGSAILCIVGWLGYSEWQTQRFMNPDEQSVISEVEYFIGYRFSDNVELVFAERSRPNPLLGDYSTCVILQTNEEALMDFVQDVRSNNSANLLFGCPQQEKFDSAYASYDFRFHKYGILEPDEWYWIEIDSQKNVVFIAMTMM